METFLSRLLTALGWLFLPLWLTGAIAAILLGIREQRGPAEKEQAKRIGGVIAAMVACYIFSVIGTSLLLKHVSANAWRKMLAEHPSRLILKSPEGGQSVEITDRNAIDQFLTIIVKTKHVWAHHSHDIPELTMDFPEFGRTGPVLSRSKTLPPQPGDLNKWIRSGDCPLTDRSRQTLPAQHQKGDLPRFPSNPRQKSICRFHDSKHPRTTRTNLP